MKTKKTAFRLKAVITQSRAIEEKLISPAVMPEKSKDGDSRIRTETNSTFELGIPVTAKTDSFQIGLAYTVTLILEKENLKLCTYDCKFSAIFSLLEPISNWDDLPPDEITPYFSFVHHLARQQAEATLTNAGFRGAALPVPDNVTAPSMAIPE